MSWFVNPLSHWLRRLPNTPPPRLVTFTLHATTKRRSSRRLARLLVMWLLAIVLPLQSTAVGVFAAKGPSHVHRAAAATLVLEDVRRWKPAPVARGPVFASLAHSHEHAGGQALRHLHGRDDASVVTTGDDTELADEALGASSLSVLALIPAFALPSHHEAASPEMARAGWRPLTGFIEPLDRPPRQR